MAKVEVHIKYIAEWNNAVARMLVLETKLDKLSFPIIIAENEAVVLIRELENNLHKRPQTHDLLSDMMDEFDIEMKEVYIYDLAEGIFYTKIFCRTNSKSVILEARVSDAVILALKKSCPIYADSSVVKKVAIPSASLFHENTGNDSFSEDKGECDFEKKSVEELNGLLNDAVNREDYETASVIRDEINRRLKSEQS